MHRLVFVPIIVFLLIQPASAGPPPDPNRLFNEALELAKKGATMDAVSIWLDVLQQVELRYRPSVHKALGMGYGKLGSGPESAYHLARFLDTRMKAENPKTRQRLASIEEDLKKGHRKVTIACTPADAAVYLNKEGKGVAYPCPLAWWFPIGKQQVRVERVGYLPAMLVLNITKDGHQQLQTVVLEPTERTAEMGSSQVAEVSGRIKSAARNGHLTLLRKLIKKHGPLFRDLDCEFGWDAALAGVNKDDCRSDVVRNMTEAGAKLCPTPKQLARMLELGCQSNIEVMLPVMEDKHVVRAIPGLSSTHVYGAGPDRAAGFIKGTELADVRLRATCDSEGEKAKACEVLPDLHEVVEKYFGAMVTRLEAEAVVDVLAAHPAYARKHNCLMTRELVWGIQYSNNCEEYTAKLKRFYQKGPQECAMAGAIKHLVSARCPAALEVVVRDVMPEDLETATLDFRKEDTFKPRLSDAYSDSRYEMGLTLGKILAEANRTHCTNEGPSSPNCKAARAVEGAIRSLKEEKKRISSPETILAELCLADRDLTNGLERLKREKRKGELSGAPNTNEMAHLAGVIVNAEGHVETLSKAYKKAARKKFKSSMCK